MPRFPNPQPLLLRQQDLDLLRWEACVKFRCERDTLAEGVATAQRAVASRTGAMPVLSGLRVSVSGNSLELVGTDLELTIRVRVPADSDGDGSAVVPARLLSELVRQLEGGTVTVELSDDDAHIEAGRFATTLRTLSTAEFPRLPENTETGVRVAARSCRPRRRTMRGQSSLGCSSPRRRVG
jgi:DNA polymerase-3 subunit beta